MEERHAWLLETPNRSSVVRKREEGWSRVQVCHKQVGHDQVRLQVHHGQVRLQVHLQVHTPKAGQVLLRTNSVWLCAG